MHIHQRIILYLLHYFVQFYLHTRVLDSKVIRNVVYEYAHNSRDCIFSLKPNSKASKHVLFIFMKDVSALQLYTLEHHIVYMLMLFCVNGCTVIYER